MIQCPNCGSVVADGTRFCGKCGSQIPAASTSAAAPAAETVVAPASMGASAKKSFDFKKLLIPGGIVLLALLLVLLVPKLFGGGGAGSLKKDHVLVLQPDSDQWLGLSKSGKVVLEDDAESIGSTTTSADGSCCVFVTGGDNLLYLFDGKKFTLVAENVRKYLLSFDGKTIAYLNDDDDLYLYSGGKSKNVAEEVNSLTAISPDGKAVGYTKDGKNDTRRGYYHNGKEIDLGKDITPRAFSNGGRLVYYTNSDGKLFVQSGDNSDSRERLLDRIGSYYLNQNGTQFIGYDDDGGETWFSENGKERQKIGRDSYSPLISISGVSGGRHIGWSSFKNNLFTADNEVYKMNGKLEMSRVAKYTESLHLLDDGKTISFIRNKKLYICNTAAGNPESKELAADVTGYAPSRNGKLFLYINEDGETHTVTSGGKSQRILNDSVEYLTWAGDGGFLYLYEDDLYYTSGGKASKVSSIKDVYDIRDTPQYALIYTDEGDVIYFTNNGKNFTKIWEEK